MIHEESEDMSFRVSQFDGLVKGFMSKGGLEKSMEGSVKTLDFANLQTKIEENGINMEERMGHILEENKIKIE